MAATQNEEQKKVEEEEKKDEPAPSRWSLFSTAIKEKVEEKIDEIKNEENQKSIEILESEMMFLCM